MSVNPLNCSLSSWDGNENNCRYCNSELEVNKRRWCSGECLNTWRLHHRYFLSRQRAIKLARRKCSCLRASNEPRHIHCADCGLCESIIILKGNIITCDHIIPRNGNKSKFSCLHHVDNLQILCSSCHQKKTTKEESYKKS